MRHNHPCNECGKRTTNPRTCDECKEQGKDRHSLYDHTWRKYRKYFLMGNPICVMCEEEGISRLATVVDHIVPHKGNFDLFWDTVNHQALCSKCHNKKSATE